MKHLFFLLFTTLLLLGCSNSDDSDGEMDLDGAIDDEPIELELYFPPNDTSNWETLSLAELNWNETAAEDLKTYLQETDTKAFLILKNGRIVMEEYFNETQSSDHHPWFSAGKTLTAFTTGIAQQEGYLSINDPTSNYLGKSWTSMTLEQEGAIQIRNQLTMTAGGDYNVPNWNCTIPECLLYLNDPGEFWFYHNALYSLIQPAVSNALPGSFDSYFDAKVKEPIGMNGTWVNLGFITVYYSTARSMARFGLLNMNNGNWDGNQLVNSNYFSEMTSTSQELNKAYGYLWWLNGKESYRIPASTEEFTGKLIPNAPDDLIAGLGANDQKLYVVPSEELVIIRMGDSSGTELLGPSGYDNELWEKLHLMMD